MTTKDQALDLTEEVSAPRPATFFSNAKVWRRADLSTSDWTVPVTAEVRAELEAVVADLRRQPMPVNLLDHAEFEMDASRAMMTEVTAKVRDGIGFAQIDRLPLDNWEVEETRAVYWLLISMLSRPVAQESWGTIFRDIVEHGNDGADYEITPAGKPLFYHTDNSASRLVNDYTSLMCIHGAAEGGASEYATLYNLYNAMADEAPELLDRLFEPFYHHRQGIEPKGDPAVSWAPALAFDGEKLESRFSPNKITSGYKLAGVDMDNAGRAALDTACDLIQKKELSAIFMMERGQIQVINNREGLHQRAEFKDGAATEQKRHLMRLWLRGRGRRQFDG
ncbi:MAG: TauD/TfdA family dioxygenase [Rhodospirillales bacterium]